MLEKQKGMWFGLLGTIKFSPNCIDVKQDTRLNKEPPYLAGPQPSQFIKDNVDKMPEDGFMQPSQSEWGSPIVIAPKKDGTLTV